MIQLLYSTISRSSRVVVFREGTPTNNSGVKMLCEEVPEQNDPQPTKQTKRNIRKFESMVLVPYYSGKE